MPTYIDLTNLSPATITALSSTAPTITQVQITTSGYVVKDDTAVSTSGGYIKITGTNFTAGTQVVIGSATATSVTFVSSTVLNVQVPAQAAGTYIVYVTVSNGGVAILVNGLTYSGDPTWVTGSTLPGNQVGSAISIQFSATGDAPVTYALQAGSTLPPGLSLSSGGLLSGTVTGITSETTYNFTVEAIDGQAQESPRAFSITITASDANFEYVTTLLSASNPASTFVTDASTNNFAVSVFGDTRPNSFGPYTPGYYSGYFDGTGDYLSVAANTAFSFGTGDFTYEAWIYISSTPSLMPLLAWDTGSFKIFRLNSTSINVEANTPSNVSFNVSLSGTFTLNAWNHIALVRSGNSLTAYLNGVGGTPYSYSGSIGNATDILNIGYKSDPTYFSGYMSNLRLVKGTAIYTSNFTPSTTPLTAISNTSLLTCQSNRFIDNSTNNFTVTRNGDTLISGFDPFAPLSAYSTYGSGYFDGTGDYLSLTSNTAFAAPADFTVEFWAYTSSLASNPVFYLVNATNGLIVYVTGSKVVIRSYGVADLLTSNINMPLNQWVHIAASRSGTTMSLWINGSRTDGGTVTNSTSFAQGELRIGNNETVAQGVTGYISNVRFVKGTAVYNPTQTTITVPTAPLTAVANTQLLTLQNNQPNNNSMFLDSSTNNFLITRNGNTTQGSFSPYGGGWSNYFDGTGDYLSISFSSSLYLSNSDFTIEAWVYFNSVASGQQPFCGYDGSTINWAIYTASNGTLNYYLSSNGTTWNLASGVAFGNIAANTWHHIALVRNGSTVTPYINGVAGTTANVGSSSIFSTSQPNYIGGMPSGFNFTGYISNHRIVIGTAVYTTAFTPPTAPLTPIANTRLLTCADNRLVDDSGNNFTITRNGDVSVQRFNPFNPVLTTPTSYSGYFDGTGDYLTTTFTSAGSSDFCLECWVFVSNVSSNRYLFSQTNTTVSSNADIGFAVLVTSASKAAFYWNFNTTQPSVTSTNNVNLNQWNHIAAVRSGSTFTIYVNGTGTSTTSSGTINVLNSTPRNYIGYFTPEGNSTAMIGYMSNLRLVIGSPVYTSNFTPSTSPLTAIANTSLLTLQNATFIDNSTNNFAITVFGNSQPTQFNPFGWTTTTGGSAAYSATNYGGSMYFDGTGDYLALPSNSAFAFGTGDFTIEMWAYFASVANFPTLTDSRASTSSTSGFNLGLSSAKVQLYTTSQLLIGATTLTANNWNHIAVTRTGTTLRIFLNGVQDASATNSTNWSDTTLRIGATPDTVNFMTGYIGNLRLVKGQALYTSNFAPPVAPLPFNANAVLQVNGTSAAIYDSSMMTTCETTGNTNATGVIKKYGNSSLSFDGTGDYIIMPITPQLNILSGDFTLECWVYFNALSGFRNIIGQWSQSSGLGGFLLNSSGTTIQFNFGPATEGTALITGSTTLATGQWYHLAVVRSGSAFTMYQNGTSIGTATSSATRNQIAVNLSMGNYYNSGGTIGATGATDFAGYVDDLRITKGVARYTANFTPPTSPFIQF